MIIRGGFDIFGWSGYARKVLRASRSNTHTDTNTYSDADAHGYTYSNADADTVNYITASSEVISTLGVIASFALLPTSLFPLAEVMNDHWTFLPYIGLVMAMAGVISLRLQARIAQHVMVKLTLSFAILLILCTSGYATFQRNKVWKTEESLWHDVATKSPHNPRGLMNYGNTLMAKGDFPGALDYFHRAQSISPQYFVLLINLAIAEDATKQDAAAEQHFKDALRLAPTSPDSYTYYARYLLSHSRAEEHARSCTARWSLARRMSPRATS